MTTESLTPDISGRPTSVHLVPVGCSRHEVDSEAPAARLAASRFQLVAETSNCCDVITRFPGETEADIQALADFVVEARLDAIGVFGYSDKGETEADGMSGRLSGDEIAARRAGVA